MATRGGVRCQRCGCVVKVGPFPLKSAEKCPGGKTNHLEKGKTPTPEWRGWEWKGRSASGWSGAGMCSSVVGHLPKCLQAAAQRHGEPQPARGLGALGTLTWGKHAWK